MFMPPIDQTMWVFGNHICFSRVEKHLTTHDNGVMNKKMCQDQTIKVLVKLEYVRYVEKILKLNYTVLNIVVLLCDWVKENYIRK